MNCFYPGIGGFDPTEIPAKDRIAQYKAIWKREPKTQTFPRAHTYSGTHNTSDFMTQRKREDVVDPEAEFRESVNYFGYNFIIFVLAFIALMEINMLYQKKVDEDEISEIQKKQQKA